MAGINYRPHMEVIVENMITEISGFMRMPMRATFYRDMAALIKTTEEEKKILLGARELLLKTPVDEEAFNNRYGREIAAHWGEECVTEAGCAGHLFWHYKKTYKDLFDELLKREEKIDNLPFTEMEQKWNENIKAALISPLDDKKLKIKNHTNILLSSGGGDKELKELIDMNIYLMELSCRDFLKSYMTGSNKDGK